MEQNLHGKERKKFDLLVTQRDPVTGQVIGTNPYTLRVVGREGSNDRTEIYERPVGSGNVFNAQGEPAGRWIAESRDEKGKFIPGRYDAEAAHIAFKLPETKDQILARETLVKDAKIAELQRELEAIRAENEKKQASKKA